MSIDLDNSRHGYNLYCKWYDVSIKKNDLQKLDHKPKSKGVFYAREYRDTDSQTNFEGDLARINSQITIIETKDHVEGLDNECLVEYDGQIWIVNNVRKRMISKRSEYDRRPSRISWITLRNGGQVNG